MVDKKVINFDKNTQFKRMKNFNIFSKFEKIIIIYFHN